LVGNADFSFAALRAMKECVIAVPALELARKVLRIGNCSGWGWQRLFTLTRNRAKSAAPLGGCG
jgi:hypothetical protein